MRCPARAARVPFDQPGLQHARRDALAWWIALQSVVCVSTLSLESVHYAGAITVARHGDLFDNDPFARLLAATVIATGLFSTPAR